MWASCAYVYIHVYIHVYMYEYAHAVAILYNVQCASSPLSVTIHAFWKINIYACTRIVFVKCILTCIYMYVCMNTHTPWPHYMFYTMGWLRLLGSIKWYVSSAKERYKRENILQKRPIIWSILLTVATPYASSPQRGTVHEHWIYMYTCHICEHAYWQIHVYVCKRIVYDTVRTD